MAAERSSVSSAPFSATQLSPMESHGPEVAYPRRGTLEYNQSHPEVFEAPQFPHSETDDKQTHAEPRARIWEKWIPPKGRYMWVYAALLVVLLAIIATLIALLVQRSKPWYNRLYKTIRMPSPTTNIVKDPYNTTGKFMTFSGQDFTGNDIFGTIGYSIESCLAACDRYNEFLTSGPKPGPKPCVAGTMNFNQLESVTGQRANCFLKTGVGNETDTGNPMALSFRLCQTEDCSFK